MTHKFLVAVFQSSIQLQVCQIIFDILAFASSDNGWMYTVVSHTKLHLWVRQSYFPTRHYMYLRKWEVVCSLLEMCLRAEINSSKVRIMGSANKIVLIWQVTWSCLQFTSGLNKHKFNNINLMVHYSVHTWTNHVICCFHTWRRTNCLDG